MKLKSILIGSALCISMQGIAQTDTSNLKEVVVFDNRIEIPFSKASKSIEVLSAKKIEALPINQTQELLPLIGSVDLRQRGAYGIQSDISIRGGNFEQSFLVSYIFFQFEHRYGWLDLQIEPSLKHILH